MIKGLRILILDEHKMVNYAGGVERVVAAFANEFVARGAIISIACMDEEKGNMFFPLDDRVAFYNLWYEYGNPMGGLTWFVKKVQKEIIRTFAGSKMMLAGRKVKDPKKEYFFNQIILRLGKLIDSFRPNVLVSITAEGAYLMENACETKNIPVIAMCHTEPSQIVGSYGEREFCAWKNAAYVQVLMESYSSVLKNLGLTNVVCIPNTIQQIPDAAIKDYSLCNNCIITVGRIDGAGKSQHVLIEAFALLADRYPEWSVHIYGDVANKRYKKKLDSLVKKYHLEQRIIFKGKTKKILDVLKKADIFAFPSAFEGFPLALGEAMSVGVPPIGRKSCIAVNELIQHKKSGILTGDSVEEFSQGLDMLMSDNRLRARLGRSAHESMKAYAPDKIWDMWAQLLENVIQSMSARM